jgi:hypothetical protein
MAKADAAARLAQKIVTELQQAHEQGGDTAPLTVAQLMARVEPEARPDLAHKALAKKPFAEQICLARRKDAASPVALQEDADRLAESAELLTYALGLVCTADKPLHPVDRVVKKVDRALQPAFRAALERRLSEDALPAGVGQLTVKNKPHLYLEQFPPPPPKKKAAELLSEKLLRALQARRSQPDYPPTVAQLASTADPAAKPGPLRQALTHQPFAGAAVVAVPRKADSPVVLADDSDALAESDRLLRYVLEAATTPNAPLATPARLLDALEPRLHLTFRAALERRLDHDRMPAGIEILAGSEGPDLMLAGRLSAAGDVALKLLHGLETCRREGDYPLLLSRLLRRVAPEADPDLVRGALKDRLLKPHLLLAVPGHPDSPAALSEDAARLLDWSSFIPAVLGVVRTAENQAVPVKDLKSKVSKPLKVAFAEGLDRHVSAGHFPPEVGLLRIKRTPYLFLLRDLPAAPPSPPTSRDQAPLAPAAPAESTDADFACRFEEAFARLDRERGGHNLVSLVPLRQALGLGRAAFDAGIEQLRRAGRYSLSAAEAREGISPEEQAAGLREQGALLLFVSRRK